MKIKLLTWLPQMLNLFLRRADSSRIPSFFVKPGFMDRRVICCASSSWGCGAWNGLELSEDTPLIGCASEQKLNSLTWLLNSLAGAADTILSGRTRRQQILGGQEGRPTSQASGCRAPATSHTQCFLPPVGWHCHCSLHWYPCLLKWIVFQWSSWKEPQRVGRAAAPCLCLECCLPSQY